MACISGYHKDLSKGAVFTVKWKCHIQVAYPFQAFDIKSLYKIKREFKYKDGSLTGTVIAGNPRRFADCINRKR